jgi:cytochrome d ubiquinol oxidase subunit I
LGRGDLIFSLAGFVLFYTLLFVIEMFLMFKYARLGPTDPTRIDPQSDRTPGRPQVRAHEDGLDEGLEAGLQAGMQKKWLT